MALIDKHKDEPTAELDRDLFTQYMEAENNAAAWKSVANRLREALEKQVGDAFAGTIDGVKVVTHRPADNYAVARLQKEHPEIAQHYVRYETSAVFDIELFAKAHPEIANQYRVRSFRKVEQA
jgi:plasmid stabilization system protein ParE